MDLTRKMTKTQNQMNNDVKVPDGAELIDEVFYVWKSRMGLYSSMTKHGRKMTTGLKKEDVIGMTRWRLKCEQEGSSSNDGLCARSELRLIDEYSSDVRWERNQNYFQARSSLFKRS